MKTHPPTSSLRRCFGLCLLAVLPVVASFGATDEKIIAAVRAADDERVAATKAADRAKLEASYSDDLHYAHSNGKVDNKTSQLQGVLSGGTTYEGFDYKDRKFDLVAPGIVLMKGRVLVHMKSRTGEKTTNDLNYLAVWREEKGKWRFLAWQSCKNPPPVDAKK